MNIQDQKKINSIAQAIYDKKGMNIIALDVRGISTMTDYLMIAEGSVDRHVKSLFTAIKHHCNETGDSLYYSDGERDGDWIVMDYGDVIIHLFTPEQREKYALERLFREAKIVDIEINTN